MIIGDAHSGTTNPTSGSPTASPRWRRSPSAAGSAGANLIADNTAAGATTGPTINGVTTLNSPLTFTYVRNGGSWLYTDIKDKITGNGGGSGNDTLIFTQTGSSGNPYWQYDGAAANDFQGNVHVVSGNWAVQNFGNPGGNAP